MQSARNLSACPWPVAFLAALAGMSAIAGCGMPGAPLPPSLNLPMRISDLSAVRTGDRVALAWSMPTRNTDRILLNAEIAVRICRSEAVSAPCSVAATLQLAPGAAGAYADALPPALASGSPRVLSYFVELDNPRGRSAGPSNTAVVLAGQAPPPVEGLSAEMRKEGVLLRWTPTPSEDQPFSVRLVRKLLTPPVTNSGQGPLAPPPEPLEQRLLVESGANHGRALDSGIHFGESYEYRAQRVARLTINGQLLELASLLSPPLRIDAQNLFPPGMPKGLAAVASTGENSATPAIDLSWLPNTEVDLAGYIVYRRDAAASGVNWQRISPAQPVIGPAYRDSTVQPGHTYVYVVSAVDQSGHESERSAKAQETVPGP